MNENKRRCFFFFFFFFIAICHAEAQYADLGSGKLKNQIWWFDWKGFTLANGASRTFQTANGLDITVAFLNVTGPTLAPTVMNTWSGAVLHLLYDFSNPAILPALYNACVDSAKTSFSVSLSASRNGTPVAVTFITADAEASDLSEITTLATNGSEWNTIDFFRNSSQTSNPVSGCGTKTVKLTDTYGYAAASGQNPVLSTKSPANETLRVDVTLDHSNSSGLMGLAFGVLEGVDRGDLPASYGFAQHQLSYAIDNACNYLPPYATTRQVSNLRLGTAAGDADDQQTADDNSNGADEDALTVLPQYTGNGQYQLNLPVSNTTGDDAYAGAWFDMNANGTFEKGELSHSAVVDGATSVVFVWQGVPANLPANRRFAFRFRISSAIADAQEPVSTAGNGEVEDYLEYIPQNVTAGFTIPDTVCVNTPVTITNTSIGASSYYWNFCVADLNKTPAGENLGNIGNKFSLPVFMDYVKYKENYYGFLINYNPGKLVRLDFGNSLLNTPTSIDLGNFGGIIPAGAGAEGIQLVYNEDRWYAIVVGGHHLSAISPRILKIDFGTDLTNLNPVATSWGNLGNLSTPIDLHLFKEGADWYGLTVNAENNTITRFSFTNSFNNTPTAVNLGNIGNLAYPTGIYAIKDNSNWRVFVVNGGNNTRQDGTFSLTRLDFGSSLLNTPTGVNLGNPGNLLQHPRDLTILRQCGQIVGFAVNGHLNNSNIIKLDFGNDLSSTPSMASLGMIGNSSFPHSISKLFRVDDDVYGFITNVDNNTLTRLKFSGCTTASIASSQKTNPDPVSYNSPGVYNINLTVDDGLPTQNTFCKQVVVVPSIHTPLKKITVCNGDSVLLTSSNATANEWSNGSTASSIYAKTAGLFWVRSMASGGCINIDSFQVTFNPHPVVDLGSDTSFCANTTLVLNAGNAGASFLWQDGQTGQSLVAKTEGLYHVTVTNGGCTARDSVLLSVLPLPVIRVSNDVTICRGNQTELTASGGIRYQWFPNTGLTSPGNAATFASPQATTKYTVAVTGQNLCQNRDSVIVTVNPKPVFAAFSSKPVLCVGDTVVLTATGGDTYLWSPAASLGNPNSSFTAAFPTTTTRYKVLVNEHECAVTDSLFITVPVADKPSVRTTKSNDIDCFIGQATLQAGGGSRYLWQPSTGLSDPSSNKPVARINSTTTYRVTVTTNEGCIVEDSITVYVNKGVDGTGFPVASAFSPNNDGRNDCFGVKHWGSVNEFSMSLFNRWGEKVFQTNDPLQCWNGWYKGQLQPAEVYVYIIKAKTICGEVLRKGSFTLVK